MKKTNSERKVSLGERKTVATKTYVITDILWDTDGESWKDLPKELVVWVDAEEDKETPFTSDSNAADFLSDEFGWLVESLSVRDSLVKAESEPGYYLVLSRYKSKPRNNVKGGCPASV